MAVDVGGTSTDIAFTEDGVPEISENGTVVGNWKTMVRAVKILTSAMGGGSHVWLQGKICIRPNRVILLCLPALDIPRLKINSEQPKESQTRWQTTSFSQ